MSVKSFGVRSPLSVFLLSTLVLTLLFGDVYFVDAAVVIPQKDILELVGLDDVYKDYWQPYRQGLYAFVAAQVEHAYTTFPQLIDGRAVSTSSSISDIVNAALTATPSILFIVGPYNDVRLSEALPVSQSKNLLLFGPLTGGSNVRGWNPNILFTQMTPRGELLMLLKYAVTECLTRKIGFVYTTGVGVGPDLYAEAVAFLTEAGRPQSVLVAYAEADSSTFNKNSEAFQNLANNGNQAILIQGQPGVHLDALCAEMVTDDRFKGTVLAASYQVLMASTHFQDSTKFDLVVTTPELTMTDTTTTTYTNFKSAAQSYETSNPTLGTNFASNVFIMQAMFQGYFTAAALSFSLRQSTYTASAETYLYQIFLIYARFTVDTYIAGYYGGACSSDMAAQGAVCKCNEGGQTVSMIKKPAKASASDASTAVTLYQSYTNVQVTCGIDGRLPIVTRVYFLEYANNPILKDVFTRISGLGQTSPSTPISISNGIKNQYKIYTTTASGENYDPLAVDVIVGPLDPKVTSNVGDLTLMWNPVYSTPRINMFTVHEYYLTPVHAQSVLTCYASLKTASNIPLDEEIRNQITGIIKNAADDQVYYLEEGLVTLGPIFDMEVFVTTIPSDVLLANAVTGATDYLWYQGVNYLMGITYNDLAGAVFGWYPKVGGTAMFFVPFRSLSLIWPPPTTELSKWSTAVLGVVWTDSNIFYSKPSASGGSIPDVANQDLLSAETKVAIDLLINHPEKFRGGDLSASALPLQPNGHMTSTITDPNPIEFIFFPRHGTDAFTGRTLTRGRNFGATLVYGMNLAMTKSSDAVSFYPDASLFTTFQPVDDDTTTTTTTTVRPIPTPHPDNHGKGIVIDERVLIASLLWLLAALLLWAVIAFLFFVCFTAFCIGGSAPKREDTPITFLCTSVDFSASLWAEFPELHQVALEKQEKLIRDLLKKYKCYEVTSDGSGFVVASTDPYAVIELAAELQLLLLMQDWGTALLDSWYLLMEKRLQSEQLISYTPALNPEDYKLLWRGLRVRIGIHTGLCGIRKIHATKRYHYFGRVPQTASLIESMALGGQCLISEGTWDQLTAEEIASLDHTYLGPHLMPGEEGPIGLYALNAIPGRVFGPLRRLPQAVPKEEHLEEKMTPEAQLHAAGLRECYSKTPEAQRLTEVLEGAAEWSIAVPENKNMRLEQYINVIINRIAQKMALEEQLRSSPDKAFGGSDADSMTVTQDDVSVSQTMIEMDPFAGEPPDYSALPHRDKREWKNQTPDIQ